MSVQRFAPLHSVWAIVYRWMNLLPDWSFFHPSHCIYIAVVAAFASAALCALIKIAIYMCKKRVLQQSWVVNPMLTYLRKTWNDGKTPKNCYIHFLFLHTTKKVMKKLLEKAHDSPWSLLALMERVSRDSSMCKVSRVSVEACVEVDGLPAGLLRVRWKLACSRKEAKAMLSNKLLLSY